MSLQFMMHVFLQLILESTLKEIIEGIKMPSNIQTCMTNDQQVLHQTSDDIQDQHKLNYSNIGECNKENYGMFEYIIIFCLKNLKS